MTVHFMDFVEPADIVTPLLNVGGLFDIASGYLVDGPDGSKITNGGLAGLTGIAGVPNSYKSALGDYFNLQAIVRYNANAMAYDTEMSKTLARMHNFLLAKGIDPDDYLFHPITNPKGAYMISDSTVALTDIWFSNTKKYIAAKIDAKKKMTATTPMVLDVNAGKYLTSIRPSNVFVDSFSRAEFSHTEKQLDDNNVGDSGNNTLDINNQKARHQLIIQLPSLAKASNTNFILTAHVTKKIELDARNPDPKLLSALKNNLSIRHVPNQFMYLPNNLWFLYAPSPLPISSQDKRAKWPVHEGDDDEKSNDLMAVSCVNLRGKLGSTSRVYTLIFSQRAGYLPSETEFNYLQEAREDGRDPGWGIIGDNTKYALAVYPDVFLRRTTLRPKIKEDPKLVRALQITSEWLQMLRLWELPESLKALTPETIVEKLKAQGYSMDVLLQTRGFWTYIEDKHPLPYISTYDILRLATGEWKAPWYSEFEKSLTK